MATFICRTERTKLLAAIKTACRSIPLSICDKGNTIHADSDQISFTLNVASASVAPTSQASTSLSIECIPTLNRRIVLYTSRFADFTLLALGLWLLTEDSFTSFLYGILIVLIGLAVTGDNIKQIRNLENMAYTTFSKICGELSTQFSIRQRHPFHFREGGQLYAYLYEPLTGIILILICVARLGPILGAALAVILVYGGIVPMTRKRFQNTWRGGLLGIQSAIALLFFAPSIYILIWSIMSTLFYSIDIDVLTIIQAPSIVF